jgi:hypothetical protein
LNCCKLIYIASGRTHRKDHSRIDGNVFASPSLRVVYQDSVSAGMCLSGRCLAMEISDFTIAAFHSNVTMFTRQCYVLQLHFKERQHVHIIFQLN